VALAPVDVVVGVELWSGSEAVYRAVAAALVAITDPEGGVAGPARRALVLPSRAAEVRRLTGA
jgi:hypothetical protein